MRCIVFAAACIADATLTSAYAGECMCVHAVEDKDGGQTIEGSHPIECSNFTHDDAAILDSSAFEKNVLQQLARRIASGSERILVKPSTREVLWDDKDEGLKSCVVPDIAKRGELQPVRTASATTSTITFSLANAPVEHVEQARLAANAWNLALAAAGKTTRFLEVASSSNANVRLYAADLSKALKTTSYDDVGGVTWTVDKNLAAHPDWLVPSTAVVLNTAFESTYKGDVMLPVQIFGHELGHVLGLADVRGYQLMSGAIQYTRNGQVTSAMAPGDYEPNPCEVAKLSDNGIP